MGSGWTCSNTFGTVTCTRPALGVATAPPLTIVVSIFTDGKGDPVCNTASADSAESDPTPANDSSQVCVNVVQGRTCSSIQDLLEQVATSDITNPQRQQMENFLWSTIPASNAGRSGTVAQRMALFMKQVSSAEASGAIDSQTANSLDSCAASLRQQALAGAGKRTSNRR